jgi:uncharacterized SAM-binding protein YcdF (DUF218 family)
LAKIGWFLVEPTNLLASLALLGAALGFTRFRVLGRRLALSAAAAILTLGLSPAANWLILPLETRFPVPDLAGRRIDGVIVLGGAIQERQTLAHGPLAINEAGERILALADLARRFPEARILFTGGAGVYANAPLPEGEILRQRLGTLGLAPDRVTIESASVDTWENATLSKPLMRPQPGETWLLVTSAWHMPRAVGIFRRLDWPVLAYPVDHRTAGWADAWRGFTSVADGLKRSDVAAREWLGLLAYRLAGRTDRLLPGP